MSIMEQNALDMAAVLLSSYELADMIKNSVEVARYLRAKAEMDQDAEALRLIRKLGSKKELYEECQRFGHFHPDYHAALNQVREVEQEMQQLAVIQRFVQAENALDELLYEVSRTIAHSVSQSVKVPSNKLQESTGGCASGGSCSGGCS